MLSDAFTGIIQSESARLTVKPSFRYFLVWLPGPNVFIPFGIITWYVYKSAEPGIAFDISENVVIPEKFSLILSGSVIVPIVSLVVDGVSSESCISE